MRANQIALRLGTSNGSSMPTSRSSKPSLPNTQMMRASFSSRTMSSYTTSSSCTPSCAWCGQMGSSSTPFSVQKNRCAIRLKFCDVIMNETYHGHTDPSDKYSDKALY